MKHEKQKIQERMESKTTGKRQRDCIENVGSEGSFERKYQLTDKVLGKGGSGTVYEGIERETGNRVAVKQVNILEEHHENFKLRLQNEVQIMIKLKDKSHVIQLLDHYIMEEKWYLVMEKAEGGTLFEQLQTVEKYSDKDASKIACSILCSILQIHREKVIHNDLKPSNFLLTTKIVDTNHQLDIDAIAKGIKIADFGLSVDRGDKETLLISDSGGTNGFQPPETFQETYSGIKADIYSFGVILYQILTKKLPFGVTENDNTSHLYQYAKKHVGGEFDKTGAWETISPEGQAFIQDLIRPKPHDRPSLEELIKYKWITNYNVVENFEILTKTIKGSEKAGRYWKKVKNINQASATLRKK